MEPLVVEDRADQFLKNLSGQSRKVLWQNNNSTVQQRAYVMDLPDFSQIPTLFKSLFEYNRHSGERPLVAVPVAGWDAAKESRNCGNSCLPFPFMKEQLVEKYAKSFSLSSFSTAQNADLILRVSKAAQKMELIPQVEGPPLFRVTPGVRITDADEYLLKKGFALPPNMPTLHTASLVGAAANGCYGPARDLGSMTTNIVEMKVIDPTGEAHVLSAKENPKVFYAVRDGHMGAGFFVSEITFGNIENKFLMKRHNALYSDVEAFKQAKTNPLDEEHFILMYIPVDIEKNGDNFPRIRVTTCTRTREPFREKCRPSKDLSAYLSLITTDAGEPLISLIVNSEKLRPFFPLVLKAAALKTYGLASQTDEIDWSADILHIFSTYTEEPICDMNWAIVVNNADEARTLLIDLLNLVERKLKEYAKTSHFPLFNAFARYLKGVHYEDNQGGISFTATDKPDQSILNFELLTNMPLDQTDAFKGLYREVINELDSKGFKYKYHPGKTWPEHLDSLTQTFIDRGDKQKLMNFHEILFWLHHGRENIRFSPLITPQKMHFLGLDPNHPHKGKEVLYERNRPASCTKAQEKQALKTIIKLAKEQGDESASKKAKSKLSRLEAS